MLTLAKPVRLRDNLVAHLISEIASGKIKPGERLPPENGLMEMSGVSRTVVREAIRTMEENGVLTVRQGLGTIVNDRREWNFLDPVILNTLLEQDNTRQIIEQLFEMRIALESLTVRSAAANITESQAETLRELVAEMKASMDSPDEYRDLDLAFHDCIAELSGNPFTASVMRAIHSALSLSRDWTNRIPNAIENAQKAHRKIAKHILERDPDKAEAAMREHLNWSLSRFRKLEIER